MLDISYALLDIPGRAIKMKEPQRYPSSIESAKIHSQTSMASTKTNGSYLTQTFEQRAFMINLQKDQFGVRKLLTYMHIAIEYQ